MSVAPLPQTRRVYAPAIGPRLKRLLILVFVLVSLLGANSIYLSSITALEYFTGQVYQNYFYQVMFLVHLVLGLLLLTPYLVFGLIHMQTSKNRPNWRAVRIGYALFAVGVLTLVSGLLLMRVAGFDLKHPQARPIVYWLHVATPLMAGWLYWLHRLAGPRIQWRWGLAYAALVGAASLGAVALHSNDPKHWNVAAPASGEQYFHPSLARTSEGRFIPADTLMMDEYCLKCHKDAYDGWFHSSHHISSFNNSAYLASVRETREVSFKRDGNVQASRWCAGCHDPVPFFSGAFDDPQFDDQKHATAHAGITCTVCHAITHVNSTKGNADYVIEEPSHYPFAKSTNPFLQYVNEQLVKAKPSFHKKTFLKPFHKTAEFCSTCHKVHLPYDLNHYKDFLRGQNHYDPYLLSGVSGHGARSFYYPETAQTNCAGCHMPLQESLDFGAQFFDDAGKLKIHNHLFPAANTGLAHIRNQPAIVKAHQDYLQGTMRVDIFGIKPGGTIDSTLIAPLRPEVPTLRPGQDYLLETVLRTLKLGHLFTQGTADSNEVWVDVTLTSGDRVIGRNGAIGADGHVDPYAHFVNVFMLDREGNRIDRRNPQDIFVPLYNHQIPPGAGQVVHYGFRLPDDVSAPVTIEVKLQYRKFDQTYMAFVTRNAKPGDLPIHGHTPGEPYINDLPVTTIATDRITLPVEGAAGTIANIESQIPVWQRWNDYGIGLLLEGQNAGGKGELRQAEQAFREVEQLKRFDGPLNLGRVYFTEGRLEDAVAAIQRAAAYTDPPAPAWTVAWLSGLVNQQQGQLDDAIDNFRSVVTMRTEETVRRKFDFSKDYEVLNLLGQALFERSKQLRGEQLAANRRVLLQDAVTQFQKTLELDSENVSAHYNLGLIYGQLGETEKAAEHQRWHARYKPDDNARDSAVAAARQKYPAANFAAEALVIYPLQRTGAPGIEIAVEPGIRTAEQDVSKGVAE
ncbi:MAG: tetratricopeptide repeat protein [Planctomycetaceae bacterium]|nr:tetratricopeptide repeat protein [Planctomycetaceae bacterium]